MLQIRNNIYSTTRGRLQLYVQGVLTSITKPKRAHKTPTVNQKLDSSRIMTLATFVVLVCTIHDTVPPTVPFEKHSVIQTNSL